MPFTSTTVLLLLHRPIGLLYILSLGYKPFTWRVYFFFKPYKPMSVYRLPDIIFSTSDFKPWLIDLDYI